MMVGEDKVGVHVRPARRRRDMNRLQAPAGPLRATRGAAGDADVAADRRLCTRRMWLIMHTCCPCHADHQGAARAVGPTRSEVNPLSVVYGSCQWRRGSSGGGPPRHRQGSRTRRSESRRPDDAPQGDEDGERRTCWRVTRAPTDTSLLLISPSTTDASHGTRLWYGCDIQRTHAGSHCEFSAGAARGRAQCVRPISTTMRVGVGVIAARLPGTANRRAAFPTTRSTSGRAASRR